MRGLITELDFNACDEAFPGIVRCYSELQDKPRTFLELLWGFTHQECMLGGDPSMAVHPSLGPRVR